MVWFLWGVGILLLDGFGSIMLTDYEAAREVKACSGRKNREHRERHR